MSPVGAQSRFTHSFTRISGFSNPSWVCEAATDPGPRRNTGDISSKTGSNLYLYNF